MTNIQFSLMRQLHQELTDPASKAIVRQKLIDLLSESRKKVYEFVADESEANSGSVSRHFNMSQSQSSTTLKVMYDCDLLTRRSEITSRGRLVYHYSIAE